MRVILERAALVKALTHVHRVVERRNTIPLLSNVLLRAGEHGLRLKATDLDIEIIEDSAAEVKDSGAITVPAHTLYDIVRKCPDGADMTLETASDTQLLVRAGRSRFTLQALPEGDFPDLSSGEMPHSFSIAASVLRRLLAKVEFAISADETRYYLNGIYIHAVENKGATWLRAVATDGHRLAQAECEAPMGAEGIPGIIVPRKAVSEIQRLLEGVDGTVEVAISPAKIRLTAGQVVLTSKLIDGTFPDYTRVIPAANDKVLELDTKAFAAAVDRVSTISSERGRAVKVALAENRAILTVTNPDQGTAVEELEVSYSAEPLEIGFNARYLLDIAMQIESETARFLLADSGSPTLVRDAEDTAALYVLMPMRV